MFRTLMLMPAFTTWKCRNLMYNWVLWWHWVWKSSPFICFLNMISIFFFIGWLVGLRCLTPLSTIYIVDGGVVVVVVVWYLDLQLPVQSMHITTKVASSNWPPRYSWNIVESGVKHHKPSYIVVVSFNCGGNRRKSPSCRKSLTNFTTWCCIEYTSPWMRLERTTLVVIHTDYTDTCKFCDNMWSLRV
jgi:hypothetical protein